MAAAKGNILSGAVNGLIKAAGGVAAKVQSVAKAAEACKDAFGAVGKAAGGLIKTIEANKELLSSKPVLNAVDKVAGKLGIKASTVHTLEKCAGAALPVAGKLATLAAAQTAAQKTFSTRPCAGTVQPCPKKSSTQCSVSGLTIQCGHGERSYKLASPFKPHSDGKPGNLLEVIAGDSGEPDKIRASVEVKKPLCDQHSKELFLVSSSGGDSLSLPGPKADFDAFSVKPSNLLAYLYLPAIKPNEYTLNLDACDVQDGSKQALIHAFPDLQWELGLDLGLKTDDWSLDGHATVDYAGQKTERSADIKEYLIKALEFMQIIKKCSDTVLPTISKMGSFEINVTWPRLSLTYKTGFQEYPDDYGVGVFYNLRFAGAPFFGLEGTVDILDWLAGMVSGGVLGAALHEIKDLSSKGVGVEGSGFYAKADIGITLTVGANIGGEVIAKKELRGSPNVSGTITGEIPICLEGKATAEGEAFWVGFNAGVTVSGSLGLGAKLTASQDAVGIFLQGNFYFTGLKLSAVAYLSLGSKAQAPKDEDNKPNDITVIPAGQWPENPDKLYVLRNA